MILTAYFDESGTHGGSELAIMAGFVADARQWQKYKKRAAKLFSRYRVVRFHCIEVRRGDGDFAGWSIDRKITFLDEFHHIVNETLERGFAAVLMADDYAYYRAMDWPKGTRPDSQYGILFRAALSAVVDSAIEVPRWRFAGEPRLKVVIEAGHRNTPDLGRLYHLFDERFGGHNALSGLTFENKDGNLPIAAADLLAYTIWRDETGAEPLGNAPGPLKADASYSGNLYRLGIGRETLDALHELGLRLASEKPMARRPS